MKLEIVFADDMPQGDLNTIYEEIKEQYGESIVDMGWVMKGKETRQKQDKEEKIKTQPNELDKLFGPQKTKKEDPFNDLLRINKKDKKDDPLGFL